VKCQECDIRISGSTGFCRTHKFQRRRLGRLARTNGWLVDMAGGGWWVWDKIGNVLGMGDTRLSALADAAGETV
jgi:hypothetical protein